MTQYSNGTGFSKEDFVNPPTDGETQKLTAMITKIFEDHSKAINKAITDELKDYSISAKKASKPAVVDQSGNGNHGVITPETKSPRTRTQRVKDRMKEKFFTE